ncbi:MAG: hypothetical protein HYU59_04915 [Magnetospirillum gryphiswaldense]|nr:hypothetical protein [Magnetospirillum gryphiswaldense]
MKVFFLEIPDLLADFSQMEPLITSLTDWSATQPIRLKLSDNATGREFLAEYNRLVEFIGQQLGDFSDQVAIWLPFHPERLHSPIYDANTPWSLCSMLILSFPEVHWMPIFSDPDESCGSAASILHHAYLLKHCYDPLMDGEGLRNHIRRLIPDELEISVRTGIAVAIDEELDCALTHAYTAYRNGFCARSVTSYGLMHYLFYSSEEPNAFKTISGTEKKSLILEDIGLSFPDFKPKDFSKIDGRNKILPGLTKADHTVFISSMGKHKINTKENNKKSTTHYISKPISGIFDLWNNIQIKGHSWHPIPLNTHQEGGPNHSAPGRLLRIADVLIARAERLLKHAQSVQVAIHGAVLASDAFELLGGLTPTTSLKVLTLRHQFEVLVECNSHGVSNNFDVDSRLTEFSRHAKNVTDAYPRTKKKSARLNAEITMVGKLITEFRRHYQFDEENTCLIKARQIHHEKNAHEHPGFIKPMCIKYGNFLVKSPINFIISIIVNIIITSLLFSLFGYNDVDGASFNLYSEYSNLEFYVNYEFLWKNIQAAVLTFFSLQSPEGYELGSKYIFIVVPTIMSGLFHFGVFISYVYALVDRR